MLSDLESIFVSAAVVCFFCAAIAIEHCSEVLLWEQPEKNATTSMTVHRRTKLHSLAKQFVNMTIIVCFCMQNAIRNLIRQFVGFWYCFFFLFSFFCTKQFISNNKTIQDCCWMIIEGEMPCDWWKYSLEKVKSVNFEWIDSIFVCVPTQSKEFY